MRVVTPSVGKLLLDEDAALYVGGKGFQVERIDKPWSRYPWATHILAMTDKKMAERLAQMVKDYATFVAST